MYIFLFRVCDKDFKDASCFYSGVHGNMQDGDIRELVANLQAALEYKNEELRIYKEKFKAETGKNHPELTDDDRRSLARKAYSMNIYLLSSIIRFLFEVEY